jgi:hypothetical protein
MFDLLVDAAHYRATAERHRNLAIQIANPEIRAELLLLAATYEWLAERAEERVKKQTDTA